MSTHPTQLFAMLFNSGQIEQLEAALTQTEKSMALSGEADVWRFWKGLRLAASGDFDRAEEIAATLNGKFPFNIRRTIVVERGRRSGDWTATTQFFKDHWEKDPSPANLLALCEVQIQSGGARFVADHARELIKGVGTPDALRLAITGAAQSADWRLCYDLLSESLDLFPKKELPADLRRLRISCEQNLGMLSDALTHAQDLVREEGNIANKELLFNLHFFAGDLKAAAGTAERLINDPATPTDTLLRISRLIRLEDRMLSGRALSKAVEKGVDGPAQISAAVTLAHELQATDLLPGLGHKMAQEADRMSPIIKRVNLAEILTWRDEVQKHAHDILEMFRAGRAPVHLVGELLNTPLAVWPVLALRDTSAPRVRFAPASVFFRHGGVPAPTGLGEARRLYLDITAYINAHELGILPLVERAYGELLVPPTLPAALVQQLDILARAQPDYDSARFEVVHLANENKIECWMPPSVSEGEVARAGLPIGWWQALEEAKKRGALIVDAWPKLLRDETHFLPTADDAPHFTSARVVAEKLRQLGSITEVEFRKAEFELNALSVPEISTSPDKGQMLFLSGILAETLAHAGLLKAAANVFHLAMTAPDIDRVRQEVGIQEGRQFTADRVNIMLRRLRTDSRYKSIVLRTQSAPEGAATITDPATLGLGELMRCEAGEGYWVWIDDRFTNSYEKCGELPVISTLNILEDLRQRSFINDRDYFGYRHRLRAGDFRYIPTTVEELHFFLEQAAIDGDSLVETPELICVRQYLSRIILDRGSLQIPPLGFESPRPLGEVEFLLGTTRTATDAITRLFDDSEVDSPGREIKANWLLNWVWFLSDHFPFILDRKVENSAFEQVRGSSDSMFLLKLLGRKQSASYSSYVSWLQSRLLIDPSRQGYAAAQIQNSLEKEINRPAPSPIENKAKMAVLGKWYLSQPSWIQDKIHLSTKIRKQLHIGVRSMIAVEDISFEAKEFWKAVENAYRLGRSEVVADEGKGVFYLEARTLKNKRVVVMHDKDKKQSWGLDDEVIELFSRSQLLRRRALMKHPDWFDTPDVEDPKEMHGEVAAIRDPIERIQRIQSLRSGSTWFRYRSLRLSFDQKKGGPNLEDMEPPNPAMLQSYLRWPNSRLKPDSLPEWDLMAESLIKAVGVKEAFLRMAALPRSVPEAIQSRIVRMGSKLRSELISEFEETTKSPLVRAQILRLKVRLRQPKAKIAQFGESLLEDLSIADATALLQVVQWTWNRLSANSAMSGPARLAFAWTHAGQLFEILRAVSETADVQAFFSKVDQGIVSEVLVGQEGETDVAYPRNLTPRILLICAVGLALSDSDQIIDSLQVRGKALSIEHRNELTWPRIEWLYDPAVFSDVLGSFIAEPRETLLRPLLGPELAGALSKEQIVVQMEALVAGLEKDRNQPGLWVMLGVVFRGQPCPAALRPRLNALAKQTDFMVLPFDEAQKAAVILSFAGQAWILGGDELANKWQSQVAKLSEWYAQNGKNADQEDRRRQSIVRCAQTLARNGLRSQAVSRFRDTILGSWRVWPGLGPEMKGLLPTLIALPHDQLSEIWELIFFARLNCPA